MEGLLRQGCCCCRYGETLVPDVWFDAKTVWEVKAADLSVSPVHCAALGLVDASKGVSIRFPRLVCMSKLYSGKASSCKSWKAVHKARDTLNLQMEDLKVLLLNPD